MPPTNVLSPMWDQCLEPFVVLGSWFVAVERVVVRGSWVVVEELLVVRGSSFVVERLVVWSSAECGFGVEGSGMNA